MKTYRRQFVPYLSVPGFRFTTAGDRLEKLRIQYGFRSHIQPQPFDPSVTFGPYDRTKLRRFICVLYGVETTDRAVEIQKAQEVRPAQIETKPAVALPGMSRRSLLKGLGVLLASRLYSGPLPKLAPRGINWESIHNAYFEKMSEIM